MILKRWSPTASENNAAVPDGAPELWEGRQVNDWGREAMARIYEWYSYPEWIEITYRLPTAGDKTVTRVSDTAIRIASCNALTTAVYGYPGFVAERRIRVVSASVSYYGFVVSSAFNTPNTDLVVLMDGGVVPTPISDIYVHIPQLARVAYRNNPEYIDDTSATNAEQDTVLSPGTYTSRVLAADLEDEIQNLRYAGARHRVGVGAKRNSGANDVNWIEAPARGRSRVLNGRFVVWDGVAGNAPDGWTKVGAPTTCETVARSVALGLGREVRILANASGQGLSQVVTGLRGDTLYLLRVRSRIATGTFRVTTVGGTGAVYGNHLATITSGTDVDTIGVILTDSTPTSITINCLSLASGDDFRVSEVDLLPLGDAPTCPLESPQSWSKWLHVEVAEVVTVAAGATPLAGLQDLRVWVPGPGYVIDVEAHIAAASPNDADTVASIELEQSFNDGAYATITGSRVGITSTDNSYPSTSSTKALVVDPAAGSYEFRVVVVVKRNSMEFQPLDADFLQLSSKLIATLRRQG